METKNQGQNTTNAEHVVPQILAALASSTNLSNAKILPSIFIPRPDSMASWRTPNFSTSADWALCWYQMHGFFGDRTRMNLFGYPGLLRDLFYADIEDNEYGGIHSYPPELTSYIEESRAQSLPEKLALSHALGTDALDLAFDAVFEFDEFNVAPGVPDILIWLHTPELSCWFFSEVKAPGDSLRVSQTEWLSQHWKFVRGHYLLTLLE